MNTLLHTMGVAGASGLQVVLTGAGGLVLLGLMRKVRARLEGRVGAPILQPLRDVRKLMRKERLRPEFATWIFPLAPVILVATVGVAAVMTPLVTSRPALSSGADLFVVVYLLLLGSTIIALAGLDAGTAFGGMGSSRALTIGALAEPALLVTILALSISAHSSNFPVIIRATIVDPGVIISPARLFALAALLIVIVAECGRLPVDNPATHLELTMIHEAMILEYAGPDLALVTLGEAMRLALLLGVFVNLIVPWGIASSTSIAAIVLGMVVLCAKVATVACALSFAEVFMAKLRLFRLPELLAGAFVLALLGVVSGVVAK
ncbi:MAG TPA: NADH-quinone oxidoreductase subunit H [Acidimicrobiales bacterium]|nr:NADH-quinone oxidoreductase subunit H [Acidimicrobiales bacterium]